MTALLVILAVLAVLTALLLVPASVRITLFDGEVRVTLRYLFVKWTIPPEEKPEKKKKRKKPEPEKKKRRRKKKKPPETEKRPWDSERIKAVAELCKGLLSACSKSSGTLLRGVKLRELKLEIMVSKGDACQTAVRSGELNAVVYTALGFLQNFVRIGYCYINIYPGFWAQRETVAFETLFSVSPMRMIAAFIVLLTGGFSPLTTFLRAAPAQPAKEEKETKDPENKIKA